MLINFENKKVESDWLNIDGSNAEFDADCVTFDG